MTCSNKSLTRGSIDRKFGDWSLPFPVKGETPNFVKLFEMLVLQIAWNVGFADTLLSCLLPRIMLKHHRTHYRAANTTIILCRKFIRLLPSCLPCLGIWIWIRPHFVILAFRHKDSVDSLISIWPAGSPISNRVTGRCLKWYLPRKKITYTITTVNALPSKFFVPAGWQLIAGTFGVPNEIKLR